MDDTRRFVFRADKIDAAKAGARRFIVWDLSRPGFGLRISAKPHQRRVYVYRFRFGGVQRLMMLGEFERLGDAVDAYEKARIAVRDARKRRREGETVLDPLEARRQRVAAKKAAERDAITCKAAVAEFLLARRQEGARRREGKATKGAGLRERTAAAYERMLHGDFLPDLTDRKLRSVTVQELVAIVDKVNERGAAAAEQTANAIRSLFSWALERRLIETNLARDLPTYYETVQRDRVLSADELKALIPLLEGDKLKSGRGSRLAFLFSLATGQRTGELLALAWSDVDTAAKVLTIPARVSKNGRAHRVPLSPLALEFLGELRALDAGATWIFPGDDRKEPMQQQTLGTMIRRNKEAFAKEGIATFTPHDARRTCRTHLSRLGVPEMIGELILGHALPGKVQTAYAHHSFEQEMRQALEKWSEELCALRNRPAKSTVVAFPSAPRHRTKGE